MHDDDAVGDGEGVGHDVGDEDHWHGQAERLIGIC
jgi:hypothetical protein